MRQLTGPRHTRRHAIGLIGAGALVFRAMPALAVTSGGGDEVLTESAVLRDPDIPVAGNPQGDVTIVEYFDYNCPYCRKLEPELRQVVQDDGKVKLALKDWPVLGPLSIAAARLALATKYQDKYVAAHDALMASASRLTEPRIRELLSNAGIDVDRAAKDLETK